MTLLQRHSITQLLGGCLLALSPVSLTPYCCLLLGQAPVSWHPYLLTWLPPSCLPHPGQPGLAQYCPD